MRYLLDTHVWLWFSAEPHRIAESVRATLLDEKDEACVSVASIWELAIKVAIAKLTLPVTVETFVTEYGEAAGFGNLPILAQHAARVAVLPQYHNDPFDRMLVSQAQTESLTLVTVDPKMGQYGIPLVWADR